MRWAGIPAQKFIRRYRFSATIKLSAEHKTQPIANVLLAVRFSLTELQNFNQIANFSVQAISLQVLILLKLIKCQKKEY